LNKFSKNSIFWYSCGVLILLLFWTFLAEFALKKYDVLLNPLQTAELLFSKFSGFSAKVYWQALFNTFFEVLTCFSLSYITALGFAITAHKNKPLEQIVRPFISTLRSAPTMALIIILLLVVPWSWLSFIIGWSVVFPLSYGLLLASLNNVSQGELDAAKSIGLSFSKRIRHIYLENISSTIWSSIISGFGLCFKVVIAAEIFGYPKNNLGYIILDAKQNLDFHLAFAILVLCIFLDLLCETILQKIRPHLYL
jgi:NitT/TauT family transport system permease protein